MVKKQKSGLPGLSSAHTIEDRRWVPLGEDVRMAQDMAARGFRIMCRERGDHVESVPLDLGLSAEALTKYFFYAWHPDMFPPNPGLEEDYQLRLKIWQQEQEKAVVRPSASAASGFGFAELCRFAKVSEKVDAFYPTGVLV